MAADSTSNSKDWHFIAGQASRETDPEKVLALIRELNSILEEEAKKAGRRPLEPTETKPYT